MSDAAVSRGPAFKGEVHPPVQGTGLTGSTWPEPRPRRGGPGVSEEFARPPVPSRGCLVFWRFDYIRYCVFKTGLWVFILMRKPVI